MTATAQTVAILGASADPERYAFKAQRLLKEQGHHVVPISAKEASIDGDRTVPAIAELLAGAIDTLTVYVRPSVSSQFREDILRVAPRRVIFNPGTENPDLEKDLRAAGIDCRDACTLVMLRSVHF